MNTVEFINFREQLKANLERVDSVIGLAFVGSAAETSRADEWSDHDFFVFTTNGNAEALRQNLDWLPNESDMAISVRETEHGLKVVYTNGHVLEFAIFEDDWELSGVNAFEVTLDKSTVMDRLEVARIRSVPKPLDIDREFSLFLTNLLIGAGRFRRGELLSARQFINSFCLGSAIRLITSLCPAKQDSDDLIDNQNPYRRFEIRYPKLASELESIQRQDLEISARRLLDFVAENLNGHLQDIHHEQIAVVKNRLNW